MSSRRITVQRRRTLDYLANYRDGIDLSEYQILTTGVAGASQRLVFSTAGAELSLPSIQQMRTTATLANQFYGNS
jgi:hypothetical protein